MIRLMCGEKNENCCADKVFHMKLSYKYNAKPVREILFYIQIALYIYFAVVYHHRVKYTRVRTRPGM